MSTVYALAGLRDARVVAPIIHCALTDPSEWVRKWAVIGLGEFGDTRAVEPLIRALTDPTPFVGSEAARALAAISDPQAIAALLTVMHPDTRAIWWDVLFALGELKAAPAVPPLMGLLTHRDAEVRRRAVIALGKIGDGAARAALQHVSQTDSSAEVRNEAFDALNQNENHPG